MLVRVPSMNREKILTVTIKDCDVQTFRVSGAGGQHRDKTSAGVRVVHPPSGASGRGTENRSQAQNKRDAFRRMAESPEFQRWCRMKALPESVVAENEQARKGANVGFGGKVRRTYVLDGEKMVIDPTTRHRTSDVQRVLDGDLDDFHRASFRHEASAS